MKVVKLTDRNVDQRGMRFEKYPEFVPGMRVVERWVRKIAPNVEFLIHDSIDEYYLNVVEKKR